MSGPFEFGKPRRLKRGAVLTFVFGAVLATGAATGTWGEPGEDGPVRLSTDAVAGDSLEDKNLSKALKDVGTGPETARDLVSRSHDRWASFYTPQEYEGFQQTLDGHYVGVGLWVRRDGDGRIEVCQVQSDSPAAHGGVKVGDRLRTIDGVGLGTRSVTEVVALLRGDLGAGGASDRGDGSGKGAAQAAKAGSAVSLGVERGRRSWDVTLYRALLAAEAVSVDDLRKGVPMIRIGSFTRGVGGQVREALDRPGVERAAKDGGGVVLDLRGNSGGLVSAANEVASAFLDGGLVATYDVHGEQRALFAEPGGDTDTPLVVLVDGGTMSAAELLAGALQDRGRAVVVGSRTFGKGSVQEPSTLSDGSVVERTVGKYSTPSGRSVDGSGVQPDLEVDPGAGAKAAERQALKVLGGLAPPS